VSVVQVGNILLLLEDEEKFYIFPGFKVFFDGDKYLKSLSAESEISTFPSLFKIV